MIARTFFHRLSTGLVVFGSVAGLAAVALAADAQTGEQKALVTRVERLERDMRDMQRDYYSQTPAAAQDASAGSGSEVARLTARVSALEDSLRTLTGQVETLNYTVQQLQQGRGGGGATVSGGLANPDAQGATGAAASTSTAAPQVTASASASAAPASGTLGQLRVPQGTAVPGDEKTQLDAAMDVLYRGDYAGGAQALQSFVQQHPKSPYVSDAQYWLGEANYTQKAYREAATAYLAVVQKFPKSDKAPQSMVKLGMSLIAAGQKKEGCSTLGQVREMFPKANQSVLNMARLERQKSGC
jgi:tol-pal system protein YbgF